MFHGVDFGLRRDSGGFDEKDEAGEIGEVGGAGLFVDSFFVDSLFVFRWRKGDGILVGDGENGVGGVLLEHGEHGLTFFAEAKNADLFAIEVLQMHGLEGVDECSKFWRHMVLICRF